MSKIFDPAAAHGSLSSIFPTKRRYAPVSSMHGTRLKGGGNSSHDYGTTLSDADKAASVEYLKTL